MSNYVDNKKLTEELGTWARIVRGQIERKEPLEKMTDYIAECIFLICTNISYRSSFNNYTYKDEMIGDAIENCVRYLKNFDNEKNSNAFAYVSTIAYYAFIRRIKKEKKRHLGHLSYIRQTFTEDDIRIAIDGDNPNDIKGYTTYIDQMQSILDDMGIELPPKPKRKKRNEKVPVLEYLMTGDEY